MCQITFSSGLCTVMTYYIYVWVRRPSTQTVQTWTMFIGRYIERNLVTYRYFTGTKPEEREWYLNFYPGCYKSAYSHQDGKHPSRLCEVWTLNTSTGKFISSLIEMIKRSIKWGKIFCQCVYIWRHLMCQINHIGHSRYLH